MDILLRLLGVLVLCNVAALTLSANSTKDCGNKLMMASDEFKFLSSPGYLFYENHIRCTWTIQAMNSKIVQAEVLSSSMKRPVGHRCLNGNVTAYDGPLASSRVIWTWCFTEAPDILSTGKYLTLHFITDDSDTLTGFRLRYRQTTARCGEQLTADTVSKYLMSPSYPSNDVNNLNCSWTVRTRYANIQLVHTASLYGCSSKGVTVYDGESENLLEPSCDVRHGQPTYTSSTRLVRIDYVTDNTTLFKGLQMKYTAGNSNEGCGSSNLYASTTASSLTSPGYPYSDYPKNLNCSWTIWTSHLNITLTVTNSQLESTRECTADRVMVFSGPNFKDQLGTFCGNQQPTYTSSNSAMRVVFITDNSVQKRGFRMEYKVSCGSTSLTAGPTAKYLRSPGYPNHYENNLNCKWTISTSSLNVIKVTVRDADFVASRRCGSGYLSFHDGSNINNTTLLGTYCGNGIPWYTIESSGTRMTVIFNTTGAGGFQLSYNSRQKGCRTRDLIAHNQTQILTSPGYPGYYANNLDCKWVIYASFGSAINLIVLDADVISSRGCTGDKVTISEGSAVLGTFCRTDKPSFMSSSNVVTVKFRTDGRSVGSGFRLSYQEFKYDCGNKRLNALEYNSPMYITSPGYPLHYPNGADCRWTINAGNSDYVVSIMITYLDIEYSYGCYRDYLQAVDDDTVYGSSLGKWCGTSIPSNTKSSWQYMLIRFLSNGNTRKGGFRLTYSVYHSYPSDHTDEGSSPYGAVVGSILGGFVLLVSVICCVSCREGKCGITLNRRREQTPLSTVYTVGHNPSAGQMPPVAFTGPPSYDEVITNDQRQVADVPPPYDSIIATSGMSDNYPTGEMPKYTDVVRKSASDRKLNKLQNPQGQGNLPPQYNSSDTTSEMLRGTSILTGTLYTGIPDVGNVDEPVADTHPIVPNEAADCQGVCNPATCIM